MHGDKIIKDYIELIKKDPEKYFRDYQVAKEMVKNSTAYYKGEPVPFNYQPFFLDPIDKENFEEILGKIMAISKKVIREYIENEDYRKLFGFPKFIEEMILLENPYEIEVPMGRFDVFYNDIDDFKFCEINTDGSSAMNEDMVISNVLLQSKALKEFSKKYNLTNFNLFDTWVEKTLELYKKYDPKNKTPNVAIMDVMESATKNEFEEFKKAYERAGLNCEIVDGRDLEYRDGALYHGDFKIDMIYRRLVTFELIEHKDELEDFIKAYMDKAVLTIGTIQSQVIHNKIFFKILYDERTWEFLDTEEIQFIKDHIPYTGVFGGDKEILEKVKNNKDDYIIKPMDKNASTGVYTGRELEQDEWEKRIEKDFDNDTIYQEFVEGYKIPFVDFDEDGNLNIVDMIPNIGIFSYAEEFQGLYVRMGRDDIIDGMKDYATAPAILAVRRDMEDLLPRINELTRISRKRELTEEEEKEREELRREYLLRFRSGMEETILKIKVVDDDGNDITEKKLNKLYKRKQRRKK